MVVHGDNDMVVITDVILRTLVLRGKQILFARLPNVPKLIRPPTPDPPLHPLWFSTSSETRAEAAAPISRRK